MQFPWRHGEPPLWAPMVTIAVNKHSDWSGAGLESGCCARGWRQTVGGGVGWGKHGISLTSVSSGADERRARRTLLAVSFFARRHADWLICSLTHLVNWYVSHFKSYVRNDASCVACYRLGGSECERRRSKLNSGNDTDRDTDREIYELYILPRLRIPCSEIRCCFNLG